MAAPAGFTGRSMALTAGMTGSWWMDSVELTWLAWALAQNNSAADSTDKQRIGFMKRGAPKGIEGVNAKTPSH